MRVDKVIITITLCSFLAHPVSKIEKTTRGKRGKE